MNMFCDRSPAEWDKYLQEELLEAMSEFENCTCTCDQDPCICGCKCEGHKVFEDPFKSMTREEQLRFIHERKSQFEEQWPMLEHLDANR